MQDSVTPAKAGVQETFLNRINDAWIPVAPHPTFPPIGGKGIPVSTGMTKNHVFLTFFITRC
jgi:hypothetical protein